MSHKSYFHFTLGPVQGFVAQARRTRDFWAGSFLLSWLTAVAIKATEQQDGVIIFPMADKNFLDAMSGNVQQAPQQGSIPNRFKAEVESDFDPQLINQAVQQAWVLLANCIWDKDIAPAFSDSDFSLEVSKKIWDRQIPNFWDMTWVITTDNNDSAALDKRKNWRTWFLPDEPGVKCSVMGNLQEISGVEKPNRIASDKFWRTLRKNAEKGIENDFSEKEAVCAITYVKRRFSRYFKDFTATIHIDTQHWDLKGWSVPSGVPSVAYMAAVHWLQQVDEKIESSLLAEFTRVAKRLTGNYGEWQTKINCLEDNKFNALDGNVFYRNNLENPQLYIKKEGVKGELLGLLKEINETEGMEPVSPFYAVLMMDGDSLGMQMSDLDKQTFITKGLNEFTQKVPSIVDNNNGFLVYAGGDDVLAILPLEDAIPCAVALRAHYFACFEGKPVTTTLSGAIEYAHIKTPLTKVLKDIHQLLDKVAKAQTGRDAIAVRVWKPGGLQLQWSQPWEVALVENNKETHLQQLAEKLRKNDQDDVQFSNKFLYKIRARFNLLNIEGEQGEEVAKSLIAVDYLQSGKTEITSPKASERMALAEQTVQPLITQCIPVIREADKEKSAWQKKPLEADGALLIRFLAQKGVEK
ncbi:CRISPR-associated RAMP Cmr2 [hydrothermal vent metagenome]|uniref:CRISPR-associated RAMP Cmr2 n=1 Tax=hydrothermal vent metagenome TaxID=652676 RepID=A0A1W1E4K8_9ZZZZ